MGNVKASEIATFLNTSIYGEDIVIKSAKSLNNVSENNITFSKGNELNLDINCVILVKNDAITSGLATYIKVKNPRLSFAKVIQHFFVDNRLSGRSLSSKTGTNCKIHDSVVIGENCYIGNNVTIGKDTLLNHNIILSDNTIVGEDCYIKSGSIIGEDGFGFDFEEDGKPIRIPHLGKVIIGDNVEIGAKNTIARGTLDDTIILDNVKTDDQVHIGHNSMIGRNTIITACVEISGSVTIGENCWLGPNCSILQKISIGNNVTIGIGSVITNDIMDHKKIMGLESLELRRLLKIKRKLDYGK